MATLLRILVGLTALTGAGALAYLGVVKPPLDFGPRPVFGLAVLCAVVALASVVPAMRRVALRVVGATVFLASVASVAETWEGEYRPWAVAGLIVAGLPALFSALMGRLPRLTRLAEPLPQQRLREHLENPWYLQTSAAGTARLGEASGNARKTTASCVIDECRVNFGPPPREFTWKQRKRLRVRRPYFWLRWDPLNIHYRHQRKVLAFGEIVWAHLVQADDGLRQRSTSDQPAEVIYSFDPFFDAELDELGRIAGGIAALKGTEPEDPVARRIARHLAARRSRVTRLRVPEEYTGGRDVYLTSMMVTRKHLPDFVLACPFFPLIACEEASPAVMILPSRYWPISLVCIWLDAADPRNPRGPLCSALAVGKVGA
jgi:hypothetical protein